MPTGVYERTPEHRAKISASLKGKTVSAETRAKISAANKGKTVSAETRARMSVAFKGRKATPEQRAAMSAARMGHSVSAETRAKLSAANKGQVPWITGLTHSDETKAKMSEAAKGREWDDESKARMTGRRVTDTPTYVAAHDRVRAIRGKASQFPCVDCGEKARDWSYDHEDENELVNPKGHAYSPEPEHYFPRCKHCHTLFDKGR